MTSSEIEAFLMIYESRSISKAAERMYVSQSALSTRLKTLETELGGPLFYREKGQRSVSPTEAGERFFDLAVRYNEIVQQMHGLYRRMDTESLRISCLNSVGLYLLTPVYARFMEKMPQVVLEMQDLTTSAAYYNVEKGLVDLAFTPGRRTSQIVRSRPLFSEEMVLVCAENSAYPDTAALKDLDVGNEIYVLWFNEFELWHRHTFGERCAPRVQLELTGQLPLFLQRKNAWALLPAGVAQQLLSKGGIRKLERMFSVPPRVTNCMETKNPSKEKAKNCFLSCLAEVLREMENPDIHLF